MPNTLRQKGTAVLLSVLAVSLFGCGGEIKRETVNGLLVGQLKDHADTISYEFLGIPYAKPPIGDLRFRAPQDPDNYTGGLLIADEYSDVCPQQLINSEIFTITGNENCLYLNLWAPDKSEAGDNKPVMVFVHGGSNKLGSGDQKIRDFVSMLHFNIPGVEEVSLLALLDFNFIETPIYDGHYLASNEDVIVVNINYRLGPLGHMYVPELGVGAGNYSYLDIKKALQWVQANIEEFGGNPNNVTLFGESAGAWNSCALMNMPSAKGLFHKVIMESQACMYQTPAQASIYAEYFSDAAGCSDSESVASCLRSQPLEHFFAAGAADTPVGIGPFLPVVETAEMPLAFNESVKTDAFNHVPLMIGNNEDELLITDLSDAVFNCPMEKNIDIFANYLRAPLYRYRFDHNPGAFFIPSLHTIELPYVFGTAIDMFGGSKRETKVVEQVSSYWAGFAHNSHPNDLGRVNWPEFDTFSKGYLRLGQDPVVEYGPLIENLENCSDHETVDSLVGLHGHFW